MKTTTLLALVAAATLGYASPVPEQQAEAAQAGEANKGMQSGGAGGYPPPAQGYGTPQSYAPPPMPYRPLSPPPTPYAPPYDPGYPDYPSSPPPSCGGSPCGWSPPPTDCDWCAGLPPPPTGMPSWHTVTFPSNSPFNNGGLQQLAGNCASQQQALSCCNGDTSNKDTVGLGPLLGGGDCGLDLLSHTCSSNVACCPTTGGGLITIGGLCQLINI